MYVEQLYTDCLAEAAYYIESKGEAAIVDPMRETEPYLKLAEERGATIKYVFETHFHADFVSGHLDLAKKTGASIVYGPGAQAGYDIVVAEDHQVFQLGDVRIEVLHTPGHTMESSSFLLYDEQGKANSVFTGDTLFINEVGRPDLAVKSDLSKDDLAGFLFDSLRNKIMTLPGEVIVYPGHGKGSACGRNIGDERTSTIAEQLRNNYALQPMSREEFVREVASDLPQPPQYFFHDAVMNKMGYDELDKIMAENVKPLSIDAVETFIEEGGLVVDTRSVDEFETGYVPGSLNIGLDGMYANWVGTLIKADEPVVLVTQQGRQEEAVMRFARIGYTNIKGYLEGGIEAWMSSEKPYKTVDSIEATAFRQRKEETSAEVLDVRRPTEVNACHVAGCINIPLDELRNRLNELDPDKRYMVHCAGGYRSMIAASILKRNDIEYVTNVKGGIAAIREAGVAAIAEDMSPAESGAQMDKQA
jgi:glyoxylase-like metal-dependent hydrolase (beta-lactamase superfamily II)/rhodanese-related sulfurtransferase